MTDQEIIDQHVEDVHLMLDVLKILEEINVGNMTPMAEQSWVKAVTALRKRFDLCPECGSEDITLCHGYVSNIETNWKTCNECDWQGAPE